MQISEAVYRALTLPAPNELKIIADWIEDYASGHPEAGTYCRRLRDPESVRIQTLIDVVMKFGTRRERKEMGRVYRLALRCRKTGHMRPMRVVATDLVTLQSRQLMNYFIGNIIPTERRFGRYITSHKRVVISESRKRRVFFQFTEVTNNWWFLAIIRQLMRITHSFE